MVRLGILCLLALCAACSADCPAIRQEYEDVDWYRYQLYRAGYDVFPEVRRLSQLRLDYPECFESE
jgi:hypothetical protein